MMSLFRNGCRAGLLAVIAFVSFQLDQRSAHASPLPRVVMIAPNSQKQAFEDVVAQMTAHFDDGAVVIETRWIDEIPVRLREQEEIAARIAAESGAMAVIWCDLEIPDKIFFYLSQADTGRLLVRKIEDVGEEGVSDALVMISRAAVDGLLRGGVIDVVEPPQEPPQEPPPKEIDSQDAAKPVGRLGVDVAYTIAILSSDLKPVHGSSFSLEFAALRWLRLYLGYTFFRQIVDEQSEVEIKLTRHPIHLGVAGLFSRGRWALGGGLRLILDALTKTPQSFQQSISTVDAYTELQVSMEFSVRAELTVVSSLALFVAVGAEVPFERTDYEISNGPELMTGLWPLQPRGWFGAVFRII